VEDGEPEGFSLPARPGRHFVVRSHLREETSRDYVKHR
jgi:hypothetical protein